MSADLTWQIIRNNSCFLRRQKGIKKHFSVERFNLRGINSRRFNGLISKRGMDLRPFKEGPGVILTLKIPSVRVDTTRKIYIPSMSGNDSRLESLKWWGIEGVEGLPDFVEAHRKASKPARSKCVIPLRNREKLLRSVKAIAKSQRLTRFHMLAQRRASAIFRSQLPKSKKHAKKFDA